MSDFAAIAERLSALPDVEQGKAFHAPGLKVSGKLFAMLVEDALVVKLPAGRVQDLVGAGAGRPFESGRRVMREWVSVPASGRADWDALADEALDFVRPGA